MKKFLLLFLIFFILVNGGLFGLTYYIYNDSFGKPHKSLFTIEMSNFPNMLRRESSFASDKGQMLKGYVYFHASPSGIPKGLIVLSHGLGGGHSSYLPHINYFVASGYSVFAFDGTGCDESEGNTVVGLPQAVIDLNYAYEHVQGDPKLKSLPKMLFGQSWGGYAVTNVLNMNPSGIAAVAALSGFPKPSDWIFDQSKTLVGPLAYGTIPYTIGLDWLKVRDLALYTGVKGIESSSARVLLMHSKFDPVVDYKYFEEYKETFAVNGRVFFISYSNRKHWVDYTPSAADEIRMETESVNEDLAKFIEEQALIKKVQERSTKTSINEFPEFKQRLFKVYSQIDTDCLSAVVEFFDKSLAVR